MCADPNQQARDNAAFQNKNTLYKWGNQKAAYHNKETSYKKGGDAAVIGYSRAISDISEQAFRLAGQGRLQQAALEAAYAKGQKVDEGYGARNARRNQYLALLDRHKSIEYKVREGWSSGVQKASLGAERQLKNKWNKLDEALGIPKQPPLLQPIPGKDKFGQFMDGMNKAMMIAKIGAAPFTGGASLGIPGIGVDKLAPGGGGGGFNLSDYLMGQGNIGSGRDGTFGAGTYGKGRPSVY